MPGTSASTTLQYTGIAAFVAIVLYAVLYYSRSFNSVLLTRRHDANADLTTGTGGDAVTARPGPVQALGLGPDDVAVLPKFTYHAASPDSRGNANAPAASAADCCAVCLDELREGAVVRMLPSCKHYFHADCVDVWLLSHATCPVCRGSPGPEKVLLGVASLSPPLPQLRRFGAAASERGETSGAKDAISSRPPSPVRSPMRFELMVTMGNGSSAMSPSPTRSRTPDGGMCRTRSPSPVTLEPHFDV
ncbi:putative RING-H2 finger protein ATL69 [Phragmites australis]|uniref:putative RING-H2 finger protein ATL69 n=1 Tax=Phragmites australis TaxID=29695 RepID=UPI002D782154|nr:putative RING-H2 finger protein ATL69 [Phragmites australis]